MSNLHVIVRARSYLVYLIPILHDPKILPTHLALLLLNKQTPIFNFKTTHDLPSILTRLLQQDSLLSFLRVHFRGIVLAFQMRYIDRHKNIGLLLLQSNQAEKDADEVMFVWAAFLLF